MQDHQPNAVPVVTISDHRAVTTSKAVADFFGKQHRDVLRAIDALCADLPEKAMRNFAQGCYTLPETGEQQHRQFIITRDGFALLCMGFTGKKALTFKLAYIDAFNRMEAELRAIAPQTADHILNTTIGTDGFHVLGMLIDGKVRHLPPHARRSARLRVWAQVHRAFGVASAENIPADKMDSARNFVAAYVVEGEWQAREEFKHDSPAQTLHNSRWLLTFDHAGKTHLTPIPQDACVMSPESLLCAGHGQDVSKTAAQHRLGQITLEDALSLTAREMTMLLGMADNIAKTAVEYAEAVKKGMQALLERGMVIGPVVNAGRAA